MDFEEKQRYEMKAQLLNEANIKEPTMPIFPDIYADAEEHPEQPENDPVIVVCDTEKTADSFVEPLDESNPVQNVQQ